jgi:hypothetical protein
MAVGERLEHALQLAGLLLAEALGAERGAAPPPDEINLDVHHVRPRPAGA